MKSPITGKEMPLLKAHRTMEFRKESFDIVFHYYHCAESGEQFTTTALDALNMNQVYNQYRDKFNIPFPDEIMRIREKYGIPANKMSEILGFGVNSYRQYEAGEMPSVANAKLIQLAEDPRRFVEMIDWCGTLDAVQKAKYIHKAQLLLEERQRKQFELSLESYLMGNHLADVYSGYRNPSLEKFTEMVVYFAEQLAPFKTKMNKLLFYADFLMFKQSCFSISGMRYRAIDRGPVPRNYQSLFEYLDNKGVVVIRNTEFEKGFTGEKFTPTPGRHFNASLFSAVELATLQHVAQTFKETSTANMVATSHLEPAWTKNHPDKSVISYVEAFELRM